jgi:uncharacterized membrane protein
MLIGTFLASFIMSNNYPKTSKSLLLLGVIIYGAGIFLIGQMFNFGGSFTKAFLMWGLGILPASVLFKDKSIFSMASILFLVYLNGFFLLDFGLYIPMFIFIIIPLMYYINYKFFNSKLITFLNNFLALNTLLFFIIQYAISISHYNEPTATLIMYLTDILYFVIGLLMYFIAPKYHNGIFKVQGNIIVGLTGIVSESSIEKAVLSRVPSGTGELNKKALLEGYELVSNYSLK